MLKLLDFVCVPISLHVSVYVEVCVDVFGFVYVCMFLQILEVATVPVCLVSWCLFFLRMGVVVGRVCFASVFVCFYLCVVFVCFACELV